MILRVAAMDIEGRRFAVDVEVQPEDNIAHGLAMLPDMLQEKLRPEVGRDLKYVQLTLIDINGAGMVCNITYPTNDFKPEETIGKHEPEVINNGPAIPERPSRRRRSKKH